MDKPAKKFARAIAFACVRQTYLEQLHEGTGARSKTGDYSDVKVITPDREIPWNELSRLNDEEMARLMKEVLNKIYTVLANIDNPEFIKKLNDWTDEWTGKWDAPKYLPDFILKSNPQVAKAKKRKPTSAPRTGSNKAAQRGLKDSAKQRDH